MPLHIPGCFPRWSSANTAAAQFDQWVDDIVFARTDDESIARSAAADVYDYFRALIALRRHDPGSDVISALLAADHAGGPLDDDEMLDISFWSGASELEQVLVQTETFAVESNEDYLVDLVVIPFQELPDGVNGDWGSFGRGVAEGLC